MGSLFFFPLPPDEQQILEQGGASQCGAGAKHPELRSEGGPRKTEVVVLGQSQPGAADTAPGGLDTEAIGEAIAAAAGPDQTLSGSAG